jgi:sugar phosphate permease
VSKISSSWFADNQRAMSTAIGGISLAIGAIIGFVLPAFFLKDEYKTNKVEGKKKMFDYMLTQNLIVTVFSIAMLFIARDKPPTAPSASADRPPV